MFSKLKNFVKQMATFLQSYFLLIIRLYWGYQFAVAGYGKLIQLDTVAEFFATLLIPFPFASAVLVGAVEFIGGILLCVGLFSRISGLALVITMAGAFLTAHTNTVSTLLTQFNPEPLFSASPFLFGYASLLVFLFGPGKISIDYFVSNARTRGEMP